MRTQKRNGRDQSVRAYKAVGLGQSVIEVVVAIALFVIFASGSVIVVLGSFLTSRLGEEEGRATYYAEEGISAVESLRNKSWSNLTDGAHGLSKSGGSWVFSGTSDVKEKFTRVVTIEPVSRSAAGDIVTTGGTIDPNTKKVNSKVTWGFTDVRNLTVETTSYLTNWQTAFATPIGTATPTPTPTPTATPTPTPTPPPASCTAVCVANSFSSGICRGNINQCNSNGETNVSGGNTFCTGGANADTCCCRP